MIEPTITDVLHWVLLHYGTGVVEIGPDELDELKCTRLCIGRAENGLIVRIEMKGQTDGSR